MFVPPVIVTHGASAATVQEQPAGASIVSDPSPPVRSNRWRVVDSENEQVSSAAPETPDAFAPVGTLAGAPASGETGLPHAAVTTAAAAAIALQPRARRGDASFVDTMVSPITMVQTWPGEDANAPADGMNSGWTGRASRRADQLQPVDALRYERADSTPEPRRQTARR